MMVGDPPVTSEPVASVGAEYFCLLMNPEEASVAGAIKKRAECQPPPPPATTIGKGPNAAMISVESFSSPGWWSRSQAWQHMDT